MQFKFLHIIPNLRKGGAERLVIDIVTELSRTPNVSVRLILFENNIEFDVQAIKDSIYIIPASVQLSFTNKNTSNINELQKFINEFKPHIIHTHLFEAEIVSRSCFYPQAKWFSHCHDNMVQLKNYNPTLLPRKKILTNYFEKKYLLNRYKKNGGTTFIAISKDTQKYFEINAKPYTTILLHNAISFNKFLSPLNAPKNKKLTLINIGSFQPKKNQTFLIDVASQLKKEKLDFALHLIGDGANKELVSNKIKLLQLENFIFLHGSVEHVETLLWKSHLYVHSAVYEPFGLVLLEAMATGLPVITLDGKGNRDLIEQGKNGYMIHEQDAQKFADTIIQLWDNKKQYLEISHYAQEYAKGYDIKEYCEKLLKYYKLES